MPCDLYRLPALHFLPLLVYLQLVYAQVSQENIPLGPLATLMPLLQMAGMLNDNNIKNALKQVRRHSDCWGLGAALWVRVWVHFSNAGTHQRCCCNLAVRCPWAGAACWSKLMPAVGMTVKTLRVFCI